MTPRLEKRRIRNFNRAMDSSTACHPETSCYMTQRMERLYLIAKFGGISVRFATEPHYSYYDKEGVLILPDYHTDVFKVSRELAQALTGMLKRRSNILNYQGQADVDRLIAWVDSPKFPERSDYERRQFNYGTRR
jgi:hypothetical protein